MTTALTVETGRTDVQVTLPQGSVEFTLPQGSFDFSVAGGPAGPPGPPGEPGAAGEPGPQGPPGLSAYQIAVANGFSGTEAEWIALLQSGSGGGGGATSGTLDDLIGVVIAAPSDGDVLAYSGATSTWANKQQAELVDGGNF